MASFRASLLGRADGEPGHYEVAADLLNVRTGPGAEHPIAIPPISRGTRLELLEMRAEWSKVRVAATGREGWVRNTYIRRIEEVPA